MTPSQTPIGPVTLPLNLNGEYYTFTLHYFLFEGKQWIAALRGTVNPGEFIPLRIESACIFGHVFNSAKCDCGYQLDEALERIGKEGKGIVIYAVDQDARGLGIENHFRIYVLRQIENLDTEEVYKRLDAPVDARTYEPVIDILAYFGIGKVRLLSNNQKRVRFLEENGIEVQTEQLEQELNQYNMSTLMLEKEDLEYNWSFKTHQDWMNDMHAVSKQNTGISLGKIVMDNKEELCRVEGTADEIGKKLRDRWTELKSGLRGKPCIYLTDFPRADEIRNYYSGMGAYFIVVPVPEIPAALRSLAADYRMFVQDWGRGHLYLPERLQWSYTGDHAGADFYYRSPGHLRIVADASHPLVQKLKSNASFHMRELAGRVPLLCFETHLPVKTEQENTPAASVLFNLVNEMLN